MQFLTAPVNGRPRVFETERPVVALWCAPCRRLIGEVFASEPVQPHGRAILWAMTLYRPADAAPALAGVGGWTLAPIFLDYAGSSEALTRAEHAGALLIPEEVGTDCSTHGTLHVTSERLRAEAAKSAVAEGRDPNAPVRRVRLSPM